MSPLIQYADSEAPERDTTGQVTDHLARLDKAVAMVADVTNRLEHRLVLVLATEPDDGTVLAELAARLQRVPLAEHLGDVEARLDRLVTQLEGLIRRCEL